MKFAYITFILSATFIINKVEACTPNNDYSKILRLSLKFFRAQRSGRLPSDNDIPWRTDSFTNDQGEDGEDLSGGYFDAGDYMKYNGKMAFAVTMVAWGLDEFYDGYSLANQKTEGREMVRWGTDYLLKTIVKGSDGRVKELYVQCGKTRDDHKCWGRASEFYQCKRSPNPRPCYKVDRSNPGTDVAADTAAALASTALVFKYKDKSYYNKLRDEAKLVYDFAKNYRGRMQDSLDDEDDMIPDNSNGYRDELAWAACWLYKATKESKYLNDCKYNYRRLTDEGKQNPGRLDWSDKVRAIALLLSKLDASDSSYKSSLDDFCKFNKEDRKRTTRGLIFHSGWATNRVSANTIFICLMFSHYHNNDEYKDFFHKQTDLFFGDRTHRSYFIGYGKDPPQQPHHRSSSCPDRPATCDEDNRDFDGPSPQELEGALVGGRSSRYVEWVDDRNDYEGNEVSMSQAGFHSAVAALLQFQAKGSC